MITDAKLRNQNMKFFQFLGEVVAYIAILTITTFPEYLDLMDYYIPYECSYYKISNIYSWSVMIITVFMLFSVGFIAIDYYHERQGVLHLKRIGIATFEPMTTIPWDPLFEATHLAMINGVWSIYCSCLIFFPLLMWGGQCETRNYYQWAIEIIKYPMSYVFVDLLHYLIHRVFHEFPAFAEIHQVQHSWPQNFAIQALASHPIEHLILNLFPVFITAFAIGLPIEFTYIFVLHICINSTFYHSGQWYAINAPNALFQEAHQKLKNVAFGGFSDIVFGTLPNPRNQPWVVTKKTK